MKLPPKGAASCRRSLFHQKLSCAEPPIKLNPVPLKLNSSGGKTSPADFVQLNMWDEHPRHPASLRSTGALHAVVLASPRAARHLALPRHLAGWEDAAERLAARQLASKRAHKSRRSCKNGRSPTPRSLCHRLSGRIDGCHYRTLLSLSQNQMSGCPREPAGGKKKKRKKITKNLRLFFFQFRN